MAAEKSKSNGLRRRGRDKKSKAPTETTKPETNESSADGQQNTETTPTSLWDSIMEFKICVGLFFLVAVPYMLHAGYLFVFLQRPEWLSIIFTQKIQRPAFKVADARQALIVGTMGSGTTQMAHDLTSKLGLEIGHENSETNWSFVRDGTVSWFHGIRFLPRPGIDDTSASVDLAIPLPSTGENETAPATETFTIEGEKLFNFVVKVMCRELHPNMGFHPFMFRDNGCSLRHSWEGCWKEECKNLLEEEWGCALKESKSSCTTPYNKILHQVRNPLKTVESLVTKFCINGIDGELQLPFVVYASALFPKHKFKTLSCIEASGYYVYEYNRAILNAVKNDLVDTTFHVEGSTPCQIAKMAGFFDPPAEEKYQQQIRDHLLEVCSEESLDSDANKPMVSTKNKYNEGQVSLEWDDLLGGRHGSQKKEGDRDLQQRLQQIAKELGYE